MLNRTEHEKFSNIFYDFYYSKRAVNGEIRTWLHQKLSPGITIIYNFRSYPRAYFNLGSCVFVLDTLHLEPSLFRVEFNPGDKVNLG